MNGYDDTVRGIGVLGFKLILLTIVAFVLANMWIGPLNDGISNLKFAAANNRYVTSFGTVGEYIDREAPFHLVRPEWVSAPAKADGWASLSAWADAETEAREGAVFVLWIVATVILVRKHWLDIQCFLKPNVW